MEAIFSLRTAKIMSRIKLQYIQTSIYIICL